MTQKINGTSYIPSLDGLRAFSISLVLFDHFFFSSTWSKIGGLGVQIFFVISGFLITTLLLKEQKKYGFVSLKSFYIRRALRILPVAYLYILFVCILNFFFELQMPLNQFLMPVFFIENFKNVIYTPTAHYWSLSVEEQFYIIFPIIISYSKRGFLLVAGVLIFTFPFITYLAYHSNVGFLHFLGLLISHNLIVILIGSLFALLLQQSNIVPKLKDIRYPDLILLSLFCMTCVFYLKPLPAEINTILEAICIGMIVVICTNVRSGIIYLFLNLKPIAYVGTLSYSLYIWQQVFTYQQPWANYFVYGSNRLLNLLILVLVAWLSYTFYEKYFLNLKERFKKIDQIAIS